MLISLSEDPLLLILLFPLVRISYMLKDLFLTNVSQLTSDLSLEKTQTNPNNSGKILILNSSCESALISVPLGGSCLGLWLGLTIPAWNVIGAHWQGSSVTAVVLH